MNRFQLRSLLVALLLPLTPLCLAQSSAAALPDFTGLVDAAGPAVVSIEATHDSHPRKSVASSTRENAMPDGMPIFFSLANGEPPYNGSVHEAFEAWLDRRGWYVETYDGATHHLRPVEHMT